MNCHSQNGINHFVSKDRDVEMNPLNLSGQKPFETFDLTNPRGSISLSTANTDYESFLLQNQMYFQRTKTDCPKVEKFYDENSLTEQVSIVIQILAGVGDNLENQQQNGNSKQDRKCPFESESIPDLQVGVYFQIMCRHLKMPAEHTLTVLALINRLANMVNKNSSDPVLKLTKSTIHR